MLSHFGEWGLARVLQSLQVRYLNSLTNLAIIRVARADSRTMAALLGFFSAMKQKQLILRTVHLGGTIRSCQKRAVLVQKQRLQELRRQIESPASTEGAQAPLAGLLKQAAAKNPPLRTPQQVLNQMAALLSQYNAAKAQQAAAATQHAAAAAALASSSQQKSVQPNVESITAAIDQIEKKGEQDIMAIDV